jgi:hypothetical protein
MYWLLEVTGLGNIWFGQRKDNRHKDHYRWGLWSIQASQLLQAIRPYMIIKTRQADLGMRFIAAKRDGVGRNGLTDAEWMFQKDVHEAIMTLNRRGTNELED